MTLRDLRAVGFDAVGLYVDVVPTTVPCSATDSFGELVDRVRAQSPALHAGTFAYVGDLAGADGVVRPGNRAHPDLVLAFRDDSFPPGADEHGPAARRSAEPGAPLGVEVVLGPEDGLIHFDWRSGLVPWPPAPQLASAVVRALTELPARPELRVGSSRCWTPRAPPRCGGISAVTRRRPAYRRLPSANSSSAPLPRHPEPRPSAMANTLGATRS